jgi:mono/diheme cytochrome c family protein
MGHALLKGEDKMRTVVATVFMMFVASAGFTQEKAPVGSAERGHQAYMKYQCYTCHGTVGQGADRGTGPKLAPNPVSYEGFVRQVRTPRQDMPPYRKQFVSDQELADIYAYLKSIKASPAAKDIPLLNF